MIWQALLRTLLTDPRPAVGLLVGHVVATTATATVLEGVARLSASGLVDLDAMETILLLTCAVSVVAVGQTTRSFRAALGPELSTLRVLGARWPILGFGLAAGASATALGVLVAGAVTPLAGGLWARALVHPAALGQASPRVPVWPLVVLLALPSAMGWSLSRSNTQRRHGARITLAAVFVSTFTLPTLLAALFAPQLVAAVRSAGETDAAVRLATLQSSAGIAVFSGAAIGVLLATMVLAAPLAKAASAAAASACASAPTVLFVATRRAARNVEHLVPIVAVSIGAVGLTAAQALTRAVRPPDTATAGAGWIELLLTLGPALVIALGTAAGVSLAQSRGTSSVSASLEHLGATRGMRAGVVLVTAIVLGCTGSVLGAATAVVAVLIASPFGADLTRLTAADLVVPLSTACGVAVVTVLVFLSSELTGDRQSARGSRER